MGTTTTSSQKSSSKNSNGASKEKKAKAAAKEEGKRDKKLPIARRMEQSIARVLKRWNGITRMTKGWNEKLDASMATVGANISVVHEAFKQVDDNFVPPRKKGGGGGGGKTLEPNQLVDLTDKGVAYYGDAVSEKDRFGIVVQRVSGSKIIVVLKSGMHVILKRAHVKPQLSPEGSPKFRHVETAEKSSKKD